MAPDTLNVHVNASCHCGLFKHSITLPLSHFPLKSAICHCNTCRHVTGQLFATFAVIPYPVPTDAQGYDMLVPYESSSGVTRYFCPTCGSSVLNRESDEWEYTLGVVDFLTADGGNAHELLPGGLLNRAILFTGDATDGGAVPFINEGRADGLSCRKMGHRDSQDVTDAMLSDMQEYSKQNSSSKGPTLKASCHCGNVQLELLPPEQEERYGASLCACTSCRKACGFEFTSWAKIPKDRLNMSDGRPMDEGLRGMGSYKTSEDVERRFCQRCGATISYYHKGMDTIDIAPGLFNAPEGSRAGHWLEWNQDGDNLGYEEDALDKNFAKRLAHGVRQNTKRSAH